MKQRNKVLLIEENQDLIEEIKKGLETQNFDVQTVHSAQQALSCLNSEIKNESGINVIFLKKKKTILVIEDEYSLCEAIRKKLELNNFSVLTAHSFEKAAFYLKNANKIDMIWLDHYLISEETGMDFVAMLKNGGSRFDKIPVFVVSNYDDAEKRQFYFDLGVNKYFSKVGCSLEQIIDEIKNF